MSGQVDFHVHSSHSSDGTFAPRELLEMAREMAFSAMCISDHDTVDAYPEAMDVASEIGIELIPSIELTTLLDGREFHLLMPFVDIASRHLVEILGRVANSRIREAKERIKNLQKIGFDVSYEEVAEESGSAAPLGVTIAQVLVDKAGEKNSRLLEKYLDPKTRSIAPYVFYKDYFMEDMPAYVPKRYVSILEVLDLVRDSGAVPVLAHPGAYFEQATRDDLMLLKGRGLVGLEVYSTYHQADQTGFFKTLAEELDLVITAGSDFHGKIKPHIPFGSVKEGHYGMVEELLRRRR